MSDLGQPVPNKVYTFASLYPRSPASTTTDNPIKPPGKNWARAFEKSPAEARTEVRKCRPNIVDSFLPELSLGSIRPLTCSLSLIFAASDRESVKPRQGSTIVSVLFANYPPPVLMLINP